MTPEELDEARAKEAVREMEERNTRFSFLEAANIAARLAREGWTPPEPVDPDVLAFREFAVRTGLGHLPSSAMAGKLDNGREAQAFLAGARWAREQEWERAKGLVDYVALHPEGAGARAILAKYLGEA